MVTSIGNVCHIKYLMCVFSVRYMQSMSTALGNQDDQKRPWVSSPSHTPNLADFVAFAFREALLS